MKIKYNPDAPEESTTSLSPSIYDFFVFVIFGFILSAFGFFLSGAFAFIRKQLGKSKPEEEKLPPEEYIVTDNPDTKPNSFAVPLVRKIALAALTVALILLSIKLFPGKKAIDAQAFGKAAETAGYGTSDTTDKLRQEWRVGSMLTEAVSFDNGKIRMDFCVMDTVDAARSLYDGMTLPVPGGEIWEQGGTVHKLYSVENQTNFAVKICMVRSLLSKQKSCGRSTGEPQARSNYVRAASALIPTAVERRSFAQRFTLAARAALSAGMFSVCWSRRISPNGSSITFCYSSRLKNR